MVTAPRRKRKYGSLSRGETDMAVYLMTPETLKKEIDLLVKKRGYKFFIISSEKNGTAHAPSKKVPLFRIPAAIPDPFKESRGIGAMMDGFYFVGFTDESVLNEESLKVYHEAIDREKQESGTKDDN